MAVVFKNNAKTTLASSLTSSATSVTVADGSAFPSLSGGDTFFCTFDNGTNVEVVKVTARSSNTLTIVRAQDDTTARAFSTGAVAELRLTAGILNLFSQTGVAITDEIEAYLDANGTTFPDNVKAQFGAGNDLQLYHNGTDSYIQNSTGTLYINNLSNDKDIFIQSDDGSGGLTTYLFADGSEGSLKIFHYGSKKLETTSTGVDITGSITTDGMTSSQNITVNSASGSVDARLAFNNSVKNAWIGIPSWDDDSLRIYGTSPTSGNTNEPAAMYRDGAWSFWTDYNNTSGNGSTSTALFISTGGSVNVSRGDIQINGTTVIDSSKNLLNLESIKLFDNKELLLGTSSDVRFLHNGTDTHILNNTGNLFISNFADNKDIIFRSDDGSGGVAEYFRLDGSAATGGIYYTYWGDNSRIALGDSKDLRLFHNGINSVIQNATDCDLVIQNDFLDKDIYIKSDNGAGGLTTYILADGSTGQVKLYHYGSQKLNTTSSGVDISGTLTSDGLTVDSAGTTVGSIGTASSELYIGSTTGNDAFLKFGYGAISPSTSAGANSDNYIDLGKTTSRFKNLHLSGTVNAGSIASSVTATTQSAGDNSTKVATTAYTDTAIANLADSAPSTLNTLNELAAALGDDANFSTTVTNSIATKLPLAGGTMTGALNMGSQNITNTGTISSGAITSSGNLHAGDGTNINMDANANGQIEIDGLNYQGAIALNNTAMHIYHNSSARDLILGTNETARLTIGGGGTFDFNSNNLQSIGTINSGAITSTGTSTFGVVTSSSYKVGASTVIDNSRNLLNIGTISSGNITTSGFVQSNNSTAFTANGSSVILRTIAPAVESGHTTKHEMNYGWASTNDRTYQAPKIDGTANYSHEFGYDFANENWYFDDLLSVGTISSGAITSSSDVRADTHFNSTDTNATLSATGSGNVYLRPNGKSSTTGQVHIATSGNATFAGTISSGNISSSGSITANSFMNIIGATGSSGFMYIYDGDNGTTTLDGFLLQKSGNHAYVYNRESAGKLFLGAGNTNSYLTIFSNGDYYAGSTKWFDQSRNLSNIGTISSGAITATGVTTLTNVKSLTDLFLSRNDGTSPAVVIEQFDRFRFITDSLGNYNESQLGVNPSNVLFTNNGYAINTTTVIDSSRNLTNIGTINSGNISSGNIVSTGDITANGYLQAYSTLYTRSNLQVLNAASNGWNTWASRSNGNYNLTVGTISSGNISSGGITSSGAVSAEDNIYLTDAGTVRGKLLLNASDRDNVELRAESLGSTMKFFTVGTQALLLDASQNATFAGTVTATGGNSTNWNTAYGWGNHASQSYATQSYVGTQISNLVDSSPAALNTLNELAAALGDDANFSTTVNANIATKLPKSGGTMTGVLTINATNDNQILLTSPSSWTGIGFNDSAAAGTEYIWHNGANGTFAIGGGGSNVANKKLHVDGGMTIGSSYDATAVSANSLNVQGTITSGAITSSGTVTATNVHSDGGNLIMGDQAYSTSATYVGMKTAYQSGVNDYMIISGLSDGETYISAKDGSAANIRGGGNNSNNQIVVPDGSYISMETSNLRFNGNLQSGTTTVIDTSRNLTNIGTISSGAITSTGAIRQTISNVGIPTNYSSFTMEAADAQLDLVSSSAGTWGSAINFVEGASTTANTNNWSIARKTSGGGNTLNFNFGTANQHDNTTRMTFASDGAITATGFITGTRLRVSDGTNGYFYSDTAGRTAFSSGDFYLQTSVNNFYNYATNTYMGNTSGDTIHFRSNVITATNWGIPSSGTITSTGIRTSTNQSRVKLGVWSDNTYGIGMQSSYTFGGIDNNYAMTFQMNNQDNRGFWWGDAGHTNAQGAMALTTNGLLTVASGIRVGYGETDTTIPSAGLVVNGAATFSGRTIMGGDGARVQIANSIAADTSNLYTLAVGSQSGNKSILAARDINTTAGSYQINGTAVIDSSRNMFTNDITAVNIERASSRVSTTQYYPIGHFSTSENVFDIDPTWSTNDLQAFFQTTAVAWTADATAPGGYAITITGGISRTTIGHRYIPVEEDDEFYMECWIKNVGTNQTHYMGSVDRNENFGSLGGNPGSYGYWVMSNTNPGNSWTKVSGTISGFGNSVGQFKAGTKYFSPQALFNYGAGSGTRACVISGWKVIRTKVVGNRTFTGNVTAASGILTVQKEGAGGGQIGLGDWSNGNPIGISEGLWNTVTTDNDFLTVYTRSAFNIRGYGGGTTHWVALTNSNLNLVQGQSLSLAGTEVISSARNITNIGTVTLNGNLRRTAHNVGHLEGSYNNVGANSANTNPIYTIGSSYNPSATSVAGMYGIGYAHNNLWGTGKSTGWGMYVVDGGVYSATISNSGLWVKGTILTNSSITATGNVTAYSDERLKENIQTLDGKKALQMRGVSFTKDGQEGSGVIAQEVEKIAPELVMTADDEMGTKSVAYGNLVGYLIETVKDQQKEIEYMKSEIKHLQENNNGD